jgi:tetratricopeptide (TPR) repeat protein/transcriptional regulator with XRE-family HTH domain
MVANAQQMSLGKRIQRERESHYWTQKQLAEHIGGSVPSVNRWEHDRALPRPDLFDLLIKTFGRPPEYWGTGKRILWNIPFLRNPYFTGRDQILLRLRQALATASSMGLSQIWAISGLGGIGKTQTALEYAYRYANDYEAILWVRADSRETLVSDFAALTQTLDLREKEETDQFRMVAAVKRWLEEHGLWLLVFDNVDDLAMLSDFLPRRPGGAVLLTTRSQITGQMKKIEMQRLSQEEGITFLLRRTISDEEAGVSDPFLDVSDMERRAAEEIWEVMDGLPLALDQAGAYIEARQCSLSDYLDLYRHHRNVLLKERGGPLTEHPDAVATTWSLAFQRVEQKNPGAAALLQLCAFLSPDAIPEELLTRGAAHFPSPLQALSASALLLNDAISVLLAYSLLRRSPKKKTLSVHRLVQAVLQDTLPKTERRSWAEQVMFAVNATFPHVEQKTWPQCERLLPQALLAAHYIEQYRMIGKEAGRLLHETATYLQSRAHYQEAEMLFQRALHIFEQQSDPEHSKVGMSLNGLANLYQVQGKYAEAGPLFQRALHIFEQQSGPEHSEVAYSLNGLAVLSWKQEKYAEAEVLFQRALHIFEQQSGPEHSEVAYSLNGLAMLSWRQGQYVEAKSLLQQALHIREQQLGLEHPRVATVLNNLASLYWEHGQYAEVEPLFQRALHIWEQQLGPEHPNVATVLNNLAEIYGEQEMYAEAERFYQRALRIFEQQPGPEHPDVAYSLNGLAVLYRQQGKYAEAETLFQRALHIWEHQLGSEHSQVAMSLNNLAVLYRQQGKYAEAETLFQHALRIQEQSMRSQHADTAEIMGGLARLREVQGEIEEARNLYIRALIVLEQALGAQHPKTLETRKRLIALLHIMERHEEASQLEADPARQGTYKVI